MHACIGRLLYSNENRKNLSKKLTMNKIIKINRAFDNKNAINY